MRLCLEQEESSGEASEKEVHGRVRGDDDRNAVSHDEQQFVGHLEAGFPEEHVRQGEGAFGLRPAVVRCVLWARHLARARPPRAGT